MVSKTKETLKALCPAVLWTVMRNARNASRAIRRGLSQQGIFTRIHQRNDWHGNDSVSGQGSDLTQTAVIRRELPRLLKEIEAKSLLDAPCGDFFWMRHVQLGIDSYIGGDIVRGLIEANREQYSGDGREFMVVDVTRTALPRVDAIFCRDCLVHLSFNLIFNAIGNFKRSGSRYLLTTTFPNVMRNEDIPTGQWRPINLERPPFNFPPPLKLINEQCTQDNGKYADKSLGLWRLEDLNP